MSLADDPPASNFRFLWRALRYRNYRLFFGGQIVSLIGTWISSVASSWLVFRLAGAAESSEAIMLGVVGFAAQIPVFVMAPVAGVWIDRWNKHTILLATQTLSMLQSFTLAALALSNVITIGQLVLLNLAQGAINAWDIPARQALAVDMVDDRDDLSNAIALNSSMMHTARLIGPALAGYLIYAVGEGYCFLIDGFSYLAVIGALAAMRLKPHVRPAAAARATQLLREGFGYAFGFRPIRALMAMVAVTSLVAMSQSTLMPIFAARVLGGGERTLGWLLGSAGLGALVGSLYLASRRSVVGLGRVIAIACAMLGLGLVGVALSHWLALTMPLLVLVGLAMVVEVAACNTVLQTIVHDDKRGRVMALFTMSFLGVAPLGSLLAGGVASQIGAPLTLALAGGVCLLASAAFARELRSIRPLIRPIYQTKGILPTPGEAIVDAQIGAPPSE